ncbi:MAG: hypothetical protein V4507_07775 [Verrucomicrobiota bacterium]
MSDFAAPAKNYPGRIEESAVAMRALMPRAATQEFPVGTLEAIREFHVSRLEWAYLLNPEFVKKVHSLGATSSGTCISNIRQIRFDRIGMVPPSDWETKLSILDLNGTMVMPSWCRGSQGRVDPKTAPGWICVNNPQGREVVIKMVFQQFDCDLADMHRDDAASNAWTLRWGGCFCDYCIDGFRKYLRTNFSSEQLKSMGVTDPEHFDYRSWLISQNAPVGDDFARYDGGPLKEHFCDFQIQASSDFNAWWHEKLNEHAGRYIPISCNHVPDLVHRDPPKEKVYEKFDFWCGELPKEKCNPKYFFEVSRYVRSLGKDLTFTPPEEKSASLTPAWKQLIRQGIATTYATGLHMEAPWDVFLPWGMPRFFGNAHDFSDLFGMARACTNQLDGYEDVCALGATLKDDRWNPMEEPATISSSSIYAFFRAKPGDKNAPVILHLVDWSDHPQSFQITLKSAMIFNGARFRATLITPLPYNQQAHHHAFDTKNWDSLIQRKVISDFVGDDVLKIPALEPWGILVLDRK